jgi:hypothetical protein
MLGGVQVESPRIQLVAIIAAILLLGIVLEMVRRRRLMERYALLWLFSGLVLLALAGWRGGLAKISHALGVAYPPNALFFVAFGFVLLLLLHFSSAVSRLSNQNKGLAQRFALLDERLRRHEARRLSVKAPDADDPGDWREFEQIEDPTELAASSRPRQGS